MKVLRTFWLLFLLAPSALAGNVKEQQSHGASVFQDSGCQHCHMIASKGGTKGPDLSTVGRRLKPEQIRKQILEGSQQMPPFGEALPSNDVEDLVAYLQSLKKNK